MSDKEHRETEAKKEILPSEKNEPILTDDEMSKVSGGIGVNVGSFGVPVFSDDPNGN